MFLCSWILLLHLQGVLNCPGGSGPDPPATTAPPTTTVAPGGWGTVNGCRHRPSPQDEIRVTRSQGLKVSRSQGPKVLGLKVSRSQGL